jgi:hypothetical protein
MKDLLIGSAFAAMIAVPTILAWLQQPRDHRHDA